MVYLLLAFCCVVTAFSSVDVNVRFDKLESRVTKLEEIRRADFERIKLFEARIHGLEARNTFLETRINEIESLGNGGDSLPVEISVTI